MKYIVKPIIIMMIMAIVIACIPSGAQHSGEEKTAIVAPEYDIFRLDNETFTYELDLPGELNPYEEVTLYSRVEGFIKELRVDRGDLVKEGQVLAVIEAHEMEQRYLVAKSKEREIIENLAFSLSNYSFIETAAETKGAVSKVELAQARAKFEADSAALNAARAEVEVAAQLKQYRTITAPFDGVVTHRLVSPGALVGSGKEPLYKLSHQGKLRLEVAIPSKHRRALNRKSEVYFKVNSYPGKTFPAVFSRSSKALNKALRSVMVEFDIDNSEGLLSAGDYADVHLSLQRNRPTFQVPPGSIITTKQETLIGRVEDGILRLIPVQIGIRTRNHVEVFGDLKEGDQIIIEANSTLKEGMKIKVNDRERAYDQYILIQSVEKNSNALNC